MLENVKNGLINKLKKDKMKGKEKQENMQKIDIIIILLLLTRFDLICCKFVKICFNEICVSVFLRFSSTLMLL